jgi:hypothetical protein
MCVSSLCFAMHARVRALRKPRHQCGTHSSTYAGAQPPLLGSFEAKACRNGATSSVLCMGRRPLLAFPSTVSKKQSNQHAELWLWPWPTGHACQQAGRRARTAPTTRAFTQEAFTVRLVSAMNH